MNKIKISSYLYPENKYLKFVLKNIIYPLVILSIIFYLISYLMLLKTDKIAVLDNTSVYVSDGMTENRDSIVKYVQYGMEKTRRKGINTNLNVKIVFCQTSIEYRMRCLMFTKSIAQTKDFMRRIIISPMSDSSKNEKDINDNQTDTVYVPRYCDEIISHELTHIYQYEKFGVRRYCQLFSEKWKIEGYADFIAGSSSLKTSLGERMFLEGKYSDESLEICESVFVNYFVGRLRTDYLLNFKRITEDEYWKTSYDVDKLDEEIRDALRCGEYKIFRQNDYE